MNNDPIHGNMLKVSSENLAIISIMPVVVGCGYIFGFLGNLGRIGAQLISYIDILSVSLVALFFLSIIVTSFYFLYRLSNSIRRNFGILWENIFLLLSALIGMAIFIAGLLASSYNISPLSRVIILSMNIFFSFPIFLLLCWKLDARKIYVAIYVTIAPLFLGAINGQAEISSEVYSDYVCTDKCYQVDIFAVLANYVISSCGSDLIIFPTEKIVSMTTVRRKMNQGALDNDKHACKQ